MAVRADPLDIPGRDPQDDEIARYEVVGDDLEEPAMLLDTREDGYAAKWDAESDVDAFRGVVKDIYVEPGVLRASAMFHPEKTGPGKEISTDYWDLVEQTETWNECTSLKIVYGPHDVIWIEEAPETYSIVYSSDNMDTNPLEMYFRATSTLDSDSIDPFLDSARSRIEEDVTSLSERTAD